MPREVTVQPERPCMCEFCSKMFPKLADLNRHIKRVHQMDPKVKSGPAITTATCTSERDSVATGNRVDVVATTADELASDPDIELWVRRRFRSPRHGSRLRQSLGYILLAGNGQIQSPLLVARKESCHCFLVQGSHWLWWKGIETTSCIKAPLYEHEVLRLLFMLSLDYQQPLLRLQLLEIQQKLASSVQWAKVRLNTTGWLKLLGHTRGTEQILREQKYMNRVGLSNIKMSNDKSVNLEFKHSSEQRFPDK